eukprot:TRINITY_DN1621_c0_g1_i2.p1 TRINITY_DN1621_c0_g1~~TRINITY_DN1621_c0_g1_i2.p1  ORF type:complete len:410 (+),score=102.32 TRINITY_DN1621_c0_g1_i2:94-1230(+)
MPGFHPINHLWLRVETKPAEHRTALSPDSVKQLIAAGYKVTIEHDDKARCFSDSQYADIEGVEWAEPLAWQKVEPRPDLAIIGLKELPDEFTSDIRHNHIMFGHVFKGQPGWQEYLTRNKNGGGSLLDLEFLVDENGRRLAAFGFFAGYVGAALAFSNWCHQQLVAQGKETGVLGSLTPYKSQGELVADLKAKYARVCEAGKIDPPSALVIGALGRCGSGCVKFFEELDVGCKVGKWDMEETKGGGPFPAILEYDLLINCILLGPGVKQPFVTREMIQGERTLTTVCDVSCDPGAENNPIPIYTDSTTFSSPITRPNTEPKVLDVISIDHLPSLLPAEASSYFSGLLVKLLLNLKNADDPVWNRARDLFDKKVAEATA